MIGQKVKLTKTMAKWYLEHPDVFEQPGTRELDKDYETVMKLCIYICLGGEVEGTVVKAGSDKKTWGVEFKTPFGREYSFYEYPRDIKKA